MRHLFFIVLIAAFISACKQNKQQNKNTENNIAEKSTVSNDQAKAEQLYKSKCLVCHDLGSSEENAIAPPMVSVKRRYKMSYDNKEDFINAMINFVKDPTDDKVLMIKAKNQFNIMPKLAYEKPDIELIAAYIFENELPKPAWYDEHFKKEHGDFKTVQNIGSKNPDVLLHNKCVICHQKSEVQEKQLAPLIEEFTKVYKLKYKTKEEFVKAMTSFVSAPLKEKAIMPDAVKTYNLMPKLNYNTETIKKIAEYLYDNSEENIAKNIAKISPKLKPENLNPETVYNSRCKICHDVDKTRNEMLAPPMINIKKKYNIIYPNKEAFIDGIVRFTKNPKTENALMFGALKRYELMPQLNYSEKELKLAAEYIYRTEFKKPEWFK